MKLYTYWRSSCAHRARLALAVKGIAYESVYVHLIRGGGAQNQPEYRSINPMTQVPVLEFEEQGKVERIAQSVAIIEYLEERYPENALLPSDPLQRARVRELTELVNSGIQPLQNTSITKFLAEHCPSLPVETWLRHFIGRGLSALEARARETAGEYLVGDTLSMADIYLIPQLAAARRFNADLRQFPTLLRIDESCGKLEAFARAHPLAQLDAER